MLCDLYSQVITELDFNSSWFGSLVYVLLTNLVLSLYQYYKGELRVMRIKENKKHHPLFGPLNHDEVVKDLVTIE